MHPRPRLRARRGIALIVVLLIALAVAAIAAGATFLNLNTALVNTYHNRLSSLESVADAGLEQARSALNGIDSLYPDSGYVTYENGVAVTNASGATIPGLTRTTWVGPSGVTSGQYGVFGSVVTRVQDQFGNKVVRRLEVFQESFAKYAYFTDIEGSIVFGANDILYGPVHSNDIIQIQAAAPGAQFWGKLKTARTITNRSSGRYEAGYEENADTIAFPQTSSLTKLLTQATAGGTNFTSSTAGASGTASMRIEFVALDLNADGDSTDIDEGFMKIYNITNTANSWFVTADSTGNFGTNGLTLSRNCGHVLTSGTGSHAAFKTFNHHTGSSNSSDQRPWAVNNGTQRTCYLGGSNILNDWTATPGSFLATDSLGSWRAWTGTVDTRVSTVRPADAAYLWPISRALNPNFKGVIHVTGKVAISGKVRGNITLAATNEIIIADNITYVTNPGGTVPCNSPTRDILGLFSGTSIIVADNLINAPMKPTSAGTYRTWANRGSDEYIHAVLLALDQFTVENYNVDPTDVEDCQGANNARGCLFLSGGIIQNTRGPVGQTNGRGYIKRYQYDACAGANPPPYFPTTGHFVRGHYYEVDPVGFNITTYWPLLVP
ncbi:MAG: hypothetical protein K8S21_05200 [Gemmatimonadetes bacterium]|nr:hypothetical protein [Gemmatimonadota bacterium]